MTEGLQLLSKVSYLQGCCNKDPLDSCVVKMLSQLVVFPVV